MYMFLNEPTDCLIAFAYGTKLQVISGKKKKTRNDASVDYNKNEASLIKPGLFSSLVWMYSVCFHCVCVLRL